MHFGENQLSRSLIGLSPLTTGHPPGFQPWWVRSSTPSYRRFNLPMARSLRFGSTACDSCALFRLAFATATPHGLTSPHTITRRLILQKARHHQQPPRKATEEALTACRHTVSGTISRPLTGALFTFPSRYSSAIGHQEVFRLTRWSWQIHTGFHGPRATREHPQKTRTFRLPDSHRLRSAFPDCSTTHAFYNSSFGRQTEQGGPTTPDAQRLPAITHTRFSLIRFRSPLLAESLLFSLPAGTEMFHFPAFPPTALFHSDGGDTP
jgi:hypothetical protein